MGKKITIRKEFNCRILLLSNGKFSFDNGCFMHRSAKVSKNLFSWITASQTDRRRFTKQLSDK